jgi:N-acetylglucosamine-6-sulfatase
MLGRGKAPPPAREGKWIIRKAHKCLVLFAMFGLMAGLGLTSSQPDTGVTQPAADPRPNILFVLADDMNASDLNKIASEGQEVMPQTRRLLAAKGVEFKNAFVSRSLCCPSRATILRGQYTHNHRVWVNGAPAGGYQKFREQGLQSSTIATWLNKAGYDTILIGKYLNGYNAGSDGVPPPKPPGWDEWYAWMGSYKGTHAYYDIDDNGHRLFYKRSLRHDTDAYAKIAERFIRETAGGAPFFMYLSPNAPHSPAYAAPRHKSTFSEERLPKPPSFNEAEVSDKPKWVQDKPRLSPTQVSKLGALYRNRLRALQSVDDMVGRLVSALEDTGELHNTYIVFTSDNGNYLGEHRLEDKGAAYEEAIRVPLLVRGPSVAQGVRRSQMVLNNDLAPTFASWAGIKPPDFVDGRALSPLLSTRRVDSWRTAFLVEHKSPANEFASLNGIPAYDAVRTEDYLYVEYSTGEKELYDLSADPYQLRNLHANARPTHPTLLSDLKARLDALRSCAGAGCRTAEDGGQSPPHTGPKRSAAREP